MVYALTVFWWTTILVLPISPIEKREFIAEIIYSLVLF